MKGHEVEVDEGIFAVVQANLVDKDGRLSAACDSRKGGYPSGFELIFLKWNMFNKQTYV